MLLVGLILFAGVLIPDDTANASVPGFQSYDEKEPEENNIPVSGETAGKPFQKYSWPLDFNNGFSSSFQEFRSTHFHGGVDLRTNQRTGYPVHAIANGLIYKIRMVKRGGGRGLYLKHDDGNISIYYHLEKFEPKLENLLKRVQKKEGKKYFGNYFLKKPIRFKRGDLIAYSGETGSGFPHLHLEIRNAKNNAINPFPLIQFPAPDKRSPVIKRAYIRNVGDSLINGKIGSQDIRFKRTHNGEYRAKQPLVVTGAFDCVLHAVDISDTGRRVAPYEINAAIDEHDYFSLRFDTFEWADHNQLGFVYDMSLTTPSSLHFNLFSQTGFSLEDKQIPLKAEIDNLASGLHRLKIRIRDNNNNLTTGTIPFYKLPEPQLKLSQTTVEQNIIHLLVDRLDAPDADKITVSLKDSNENTLYAGDFKHRVISKPQGFTLNGAFQKIRFIDFYFHKNGIQYYRKRFLVDSQWLSSITDIDTDIYINRDDVYVEIPDPLFTCDHLRLTVKQGAAGVAVKPQCTGNNVYFRFKPLNTVDTVRLHFEILNNNQKVVEIQKQLKLIHLIPGTRHMFQYAEFSAQFDTKSVYEPRVMLMEETDFPSDFPVLSKQIRLSPDHFPFLDTVYYRFTKTVDNPRQVGIFRYYPKTKKWGYRYTVYDNAAHTFKHRLRSSGTFALMRDIYAPKIYFRKPKTSYKKKVWRLNIKITDKGMGVDDEALVIKLNDKIVDVEYDPDWKRASVSDLRYLIRGKNTLRVDAKDYAGNRTVKTYTLYLK